MLETLRNIINPEVKVKHQSKVLVFEEPSQDAKLKKITFRLTEYHRCGGGELSQAVIMKSDSDLMIYKSFSHFLNSTCASINRKCDYIIFHAVGDDIRIILCELKSSVHGANGRCLEQFEASRKFADYIISLARMYQDFSDEREFNPANITVHKIIFYPLPSVAGSVPVSHDTSNTFDRNKKVCPDGTIHYVIPVNGLCESTQVWQHLMESIP